MLVLAWGAYLLIFEKDASTTNYVTASLNIVVFVSVLLTTRMGTRATYAGIEVVQYRTRQQTWPEIASLHTEGSRWGAGNVTADLVDGDRIQLIAVPHDDLPLLERFRHHQGDQA